MFTKQKHSSSRKMSNLSQSPIGQISANSNMSVAETGKLTSSSNTMMMPSPSNEEGNSNSLTPTSSIDQETLSSAFQQQQAVICEKVMQPPDEQPYFPEKWPGKVCALCCLSERSQLGQGEMLRIESKDEEAKSASKNSYAELIHNSENKGPRTVAAPPISVRRQKGLNKCKLVNKYLNIKLLCDSIVLIYSVLCLPQSV